MKKFNIPEDSLSISKSRSSLGRMQSQKPPIFDPDKNFMNSMPINGHKMQRLQGNTKARAKRETSKKIDESVRKVFDRIARDEVNQMYNLTIDTQSHQ